jgi:hypothetical protein
VYPSEALENDLLEKKHEKNRRSPFMVEKEIGKIKKNDTSDIVIRIDDFGGKTGLTIREFVTSDRYTGFTKAGVRIQAADFLKFREMINSIPLSDMQETGEKTIPIKSNNKSQKRLNNSEKEIDY